jgi:GTP-binding protein EngB required for normal cell division
MTPRSNSLLGGVMPERDQKAEMTRHTGELNEHHKTRLRITCQYIDKLLSDIADIFHAAASPSPFPRYVVDISPAQIRVLEDYIRRFRTQLVQTIAWQNMKPEPPDIPATRAVLTNLAFVDIAVEELKPSYMRGSGPVPEDAINELNGAVHELRSLITGMERYLKQELTTDLEKRLRRLERSGLDVNLLRLLEQIVTRNGLVEFRPRIDALASRLEDDSFELALFGRVSSGKSSLLNALLGTDVLPVGINPITAVPTKLRYGPTLKAAVAYGDGRSEIVSIEELSRLVTEQGNPGNLKNVVRAIVEVPSPRLKQGVLLVDTPGLGSLARRGAAETLAYLPSCDLALLLIDAGATLNDEDIGTLRLLYEAGIPALVLLSKADLLGEGDLHRAIHYIQEHIKRDLRLDVAVHPVSAVEHYSILLDQFFERELFPRFEKARAFRDSSVARKIGALREALIAAMESSLHREKRDMTQAQENTPELETLLRVITGEVGEQRTALDHAFHRFGETPDAVLDAVTQEAVAWVRQNATPQISSLKLSEWIHDAVSRSVEPPLGKFRSIGQHAVESLQKTAKDMGRTDAPSLQDFEMLFRDLPRFELAALPDNIGLSRWTLWGDGVLRSRIRASLRESIGSHLREELHLYGMALSQWSEQIVRKLEMLVNSYADAYRVQLHRVSGVSSKVVDLNQMKADLDTLIHRDANKSAADIEEQRV